MFQRNLNTMTFQIFLLQELGEVQNAVVALGSTACVLEMGVTVGGIFRI